MKDFKKILSVFALTTFVIIALGFLASNANAQCQCSTDAPPALLDTYWCTLECDLCEDGDGGACNACARLEIVFFMIGDPCCEPLSCGGGIPLP